MTIKITPEMIAAGAKILEACGYGAGISERVAEDVLRAALPMAVHGVGKDEYRDQEQDPYEREMRTHLGKIGHILKQR